MSDNIDISIRIPSDAQSRAHTPFMGHADFIKYCKANRVDVNESALEGYEKKGLLFPCVRVLYPRELIRRYFRASRDQYGSRYKIRDEWKPLIELEKAMQNDTLWMDKEYERNVERGHPLECALLDKHPFVIDPAIQKYKAWSNYRIIEGEIDGHKIKTSRADHYYAPWKIFHLFELNELNTDEINRATGRRRGWGFIDKKVRPSSLNEFDDYFKIISSFSYRRYLLRVNYNEATKHTTNDWKRMSSRRKQIAERLFSAYFYKKWIRFLRKLIELHENYREMEKYILSEAASSYIGRTVIFLRNATGYAFQKVCQDVSGPYDKYLGIGMEDEVKVYAGRLEEMFPDEKWDLEQNVKDLIVHELKRFNASLSEGERIPEIISEQLFNELAKEPEGTSLAAVRKLDKAYSDPGLWYDTEIWSGIRDLAISIEVHGKEWHGGKKLDVVFRNLFSSPTHNYDSLKKMTGIDKFTDANDTKEFLSKLALVESLKQIPTDRRCGRHLLIAHLTRNYASHQKGLTGKNLRENLSKIYSALISTLLVLYAGYKKQ